MLNIFFMDSLDELPIDTEAIEDRLLVTKHDENWERTGTNNNITNW